MSSRSMSTPARRRSSRGATVAGVGTVLYAMAVHPTDGTLFVANTEARNEIRFEPLIDATHGLQGRFVDNRITVISPTGGVPGSVVAVGLNPHADHIRPTGPASEVAENLALPTAIAFSADGRRLYATAFGIRTDRDPWILPRSAPGSSVGRLVEVGGGPSGLALDERTRPPLRAESLRPDHRRGGGRCRAEEGARRLDHPRGIRPVATGRDTGAAVPVRWPAVGARRRRVRELSCARTSTVSHGTWVIPDGSIQPNANDPALPPWHPMKGPMTTQPLRGLAGAGPMHWRGDRGRRPLRVHARRASAAPDRRPPHHRHRRRLVRGSGGRRDTRTR